jgi:outer membrane protein assembly factor BamD (BamD/ComL family)
MGWPRYAKAVEVYEDLMRIAPAGDRGPDDALRLGQLQVKAGDRELAVVTFREILRRHPRSSAAPRAHLELGRALLDLADAGDGDGRLKREARLHLERFLERGTDGAARQEAEDLLRSCRAQEAEQLLALGEFYLRPVHARPKAARRYLHDLIQTYPEVDVAEEAEELLAQVQADADEGQDVDSGGSAEAAPERSPEPPVGAPEGMERLQEQERMEKWLRPVEDLGLTREEEDQP